MERFKVVIIGGGILGCTVARELSKYKLDVLVIEKSNDIGEGSAKTNSGILAAGFHPRGGSIKGMSCVYGNEMYKKICEELEVSVKYIGSLFVAFSKDGMEMIAEKYTKGKINGVKGMQIIDGDMARHMQPGLSPKVVQALYAPSTGIIDTFGLLLKTAQNAAENAVNFQFGTKVLKLERNSRCYLIHTDKGSFEAEYIVNTAGGNADEIESFIRPRDYVIKPRRGQFYVFDKSAGDMISHVIYQAQDRDEKGCLLAPTIEGNLIAGPTSEDVVSYDRVETTKDGLELIGRVAKKILPDIEMNRIINSFAGVRANISNVEKEIKDFVIRKSGDRVVSALGIKNPGMTSAPYLSLKIIEVLVKEGLGLEKKNDFNPKVNIKKKFLECTQAEQKQMLKDDSRYGNIICRCEKITEGDILRVLKEPLPPKNLNGLKKRLRISMGKCQGSFCIPRVIEILSREWKAEPQEVLKSGKNSRFVKGWLKI